MRGQALSRRQAAYSRAFTHALRSSADPAFWIFFWAYTSAAIFMLLLGVGAALAGIFPRLQFAFATWGRDSNVLAPIFKAMFVASRLAISQDNVQIAFDYVLSALNLFFALFLIWRRPKNGVARLLSIGMIGTAAAFNYQSHTIITTAGHHIYNLHFLFHSVSASAYLTALLLFPNSRLLPPQARWFLAVIYALTALELILLWGLGTGLITFASLLIALPRALAVTGLTFDQLMNSSDLMGVLLKAGAVDQVLGILLNEELIFFILFFGMLVPLVGVISQVYHSREAATRFERQQSRLLLWALGLAFAIAIPFFLVNLWINVAGGANLSTEAILNTELQLLKITPVLFAVIPITLFICILRYHLFDVDLLINRTLVYLPLTGILAGIFAATIALTQRLFLALTGEQSVAAPILTTLIVVAAFEPVKTRLQELVDRRFKTAAHPLKRFASFGEQLEANLGVIDSHRVVWRFLKEAVLAFNTTSGAIYLGSEEAEQMVQTRGEWKNEPALTVFLENEEKRVGRIALGKRRGEESYSSADRALLQQVANIVADTIQMSLSASDGRQ